MGRFPPLRMRTTIGLPLRGPFLWIDIRVVIFPAHRPISLMLEHGLIHDYGIPRRLTQTPPMNPQVKKAWYANIMTTATMPDVRVLTASIAATTAMTMPIQQADSINSLRRPTRSINHQVSVDAKRNHSCRKIDMSRDKCREKPTEF